MPSHAGQPCCSRPWTFLCAPVDPGIIRLCLARPSDLDDDVLRLDGHRDRLGDVGALHQAVAGGDLHRVLPGPDPRRIAPGLAGAHVEFPAMPGTTDDLARTR